MKFSRQTDSKVEEQGAPTSASERREHGRINWFALLLVTLAVTWSVLSCPPVVLDLSADYSLNGVLNHAAEKQLQFGTELVSTYGPLGYLIFPQYSSHAPALRMVTDLLVCFAISFGMCLLAWRLRWIWRALFLFVFTWAVTNVWLRTDLLLHSGLFCWWLLSINERGRQQSLCGVGFVVLGAFCALAKISLLFLVLPPLAVLVIALLLSRRFLEAAGLITLFGILFLAGWTIAGQHPANIPTYLERSIAVARAYNACLGVEGFRAVHTPGIAIALVATAMLSLRLFAGPSGDQGRVRRLLLLVACLFFTFTIWKHGFVRGDTYHVAFFLGFIPVLVFGLETVPGESGPARLWGRILGASCAALAVLALQHFIFAPAPRSLWQPFASLEGNLKRVFLPSRFTTTAAQVLEQQRRDCALPQLGKLAGEAPIDVFGQNQAYALLNGLNYQPRPVFQSYSACSAELMRKNEEYFFSKTSPDLWLFQLAPLDRKFAPLEDAWLLRALLMNCELIGTEKDFLLLKRVSREKPRSAVLEEGSLRPGESLDIRKWGDTALWIEIELEPSFAGEIRQLAYRPPTVRLAAWREPGRELLYRHQAAWPMLKAGFLASPLLKRTQDAQQLLAEKRSIRPGAYTLELGDSASWWRERANYRVYRLDQ